MPIYASLITLVLLKLVACDYRCLCNYNTEKTVYTTASTIVSVLGYMYEFDCKPYVGKAAVNPWIMIAFEHKLGYAENDGKLQIQTCPGSVPDEDKLASPPTTPAPSTTTPTMSTEPSSSVGSSTQSVSSNPTSTYSVSTPTSTTKATPTSASTLSTRITSMQPPSTNAAATSTSATSSVTTSTQAMTTRVASTTANSTTTILTQSTTYPLSSSTLNTNIYSLSTDAQTHLISSTLASTTKSLTKAPENITSIPTSRMTTRMPSSTSLEQSEPTTTTTEKLRTTKLSTMTSRLPQTTTNMQTTVKTTTLPLVGRVELCPTGIRLEASGSNRTKLAQFGQKCYEVVQSKVSWSHALRICQANHGQLVDIASQEEQDYIYDFLVKIRSHTVWLGLHDRNTEETFVWTSGAPVTYTHWKVERKNIYSHNYQDCVYMTVNGTWDDINCGSDNPATEQQKGFLHSYMCQYELVDPLDGEVMNCPQSVQTQAVKDRGILSQYGHSCYELVPEVAVAWQHAEDVCKARGGHLVAIASAEEQSFILGFMSRHSPTTPVWIGLTDADSEGHFRWSSGGTAQYTNWVPNHSNNEHEDCVVFIPNKNGQWDDRSCGTSHHYVSGITDAGEKHPLLCQYRTFINRAVPQENQRSGSATSMEPDEPAHPCSLIRSHAVHSDLARGTASGASIIG